MQNWIYVGTANFGANPGVSLSGLEYDEILVIATLPGFNIYRLVDITTTPPTYEVMSTNPSFSFYWIPILGEVQLSQTFTQGVNSSSINDLLITISFSSTNIRTHDVLSIRHNGNYATNINTASHGYIDVYCR